MWNMGLFGAETSRIHYEFARAAGMTEWWHWMTLVAVCACLLAFMVWLYVRDSSELSEGVRWTLLVLRVSAFLGILFFFLDMQRRTERDLTKSSRVVMMVDTSQSMGLKDVGSSASSRRRVDEVLASLKNGDLIDELREQHDVVVYRFDQDAKPVEIGSFPRTSPIGNRQTAEGRVEDQLATLVEARAGLVTAGVLFGVGILAALFLVIFGMRGSEDTPSWSLLVLMVTFIGGVIIAATVKLRVPDMPLGVLVGLQEPNFEDSDNEKSDEEEIKATKVDWNEALAPRGVETRIGDSVHYVIDQERSGPIAGVLVITDGGNNNGLAPERAVLAAKDAVIPIYTIGLGSQDRPQNARIADIDAPQRVYPGDRFTLTGYVQSFGLKNKPVQVELSARPATEDTQNSAEFEYEQHELSNFGKDGDLVPIKFDIEPPSEGYWEYKVKIVGVSEDSEPADNERVVRVQVVERRNRVLMLAGGPTREYRFLRNLLYRDPEIHLSILLQSGLPGLSQESDELLESFPETSEEMFRYDCVIAFDPDWMELSEEQVKLLERWVAEQAGGLLTVAGPVHTPQWTRFNPRSSDRRLRQLRDLYPVVLYRSGSPTLSLGRFGGTEPWQLSFTRDGEEAEFLWLADDSIASEQAWAEFEGVYGYYAVKDPKPGARIYAHFSDPSTKIDGQLPIYLAGHYYGAGRVFFQASGEMWRVRAVDDTYFQQYYTKLIRWVSQGRLLRDSTKGVLLADKERCMLGDQVGIRAILTNEQHEPLDVSEVKAVLFHPDGTQSELVLQQMKDAGAGAGSRGGVFAGQFTAKLDGDYRVELDPPGAADQGTLTREVQSRVPQREVEQPEQNVKLLRQMADDTGGTYYDSMAAAAGRGQQGSVSSLISPNDQTIPLPFIPDKNFDRQLMGWLMAMICGALCLEWLVRRICKLA